MLSVMNINVILILIFEFKIIKILGLHNENVRIVGGERAKESEFPYFVQIKRDKEKKFYAGVLIHEQAALSVASCCSDKYATDYFILVGSIYRNEGKKYFISDIVSHANPETDNIVILILHNKVEFSSIVKIISIVQKNEVPEYKMLMTVCGFGRTNISEPYSQVLLKTQIEYVPYEMCIALLSEQIGPTEICSVSHSGIEDVCYGDVGSPMIFEDVLIGITLPHVKCGEDQKLSRFINVLLYRDWIDKTLLDFYEFFNPLKNDLRKIRCDSSKRELLQWIYYVENVELIFYSDNYRSPVSNTSCAPIPVSYHDLIILFSCVAYKKNASLKMKLNEKFYTIQSITTGADLLPYFTTSKYDITFVKIVELLQLPLNMPILDIFPIFQQIIPHQGYLINYIIDINTKNTTLISIPVEVSTSNCYSLKKLVPFEIVNDMFCMSVFCENYLNEKGLCSDKAGSPIFDQTGSLIGLVVWQAECKTHLFIVGLRVSRFYEAYKEIKTY